jgi:antitoxin ParD1/3/4
MLYFDIDRRDAMNVSVGKRWEEFVAEAVRSGRYGSASEVVREGLRLVEEREARLAELRAEIKAALDEGGDLSDADVGAALDSADAGLAQQRN